MRCEASRTGEGFFPRTQTPHPADCVRHLLPQGEKEEVRPADQGFEAEGLVHKSIFELML